VATVPAASLPRLIAVEHDGNEPQGRAVLFQERDPPLRELSPRHDHPQRCRRILHHVEFRAFIRPQLRREERVMQGR
jgi:hypothetical protein